MEVLYQNLLAIELNQVVMWAIAKDMEPTLLPMGFDAILVNLPNSGAAVQHGVSIVTLLNQ